jgi:hypothetical protein
MMENNEIEQSKQEVFSLVKSVESQIKIKILTKIDYDIAGNEVVGLTKKLEFIKASKFYEHKKDLKATYDDYCKTLDGVIKPIEAMIESYKGEQKKWMLAEMEREAEERRKANEAARKEEEKKQAELLARSAKAEEKGKTEKAEELLQKAEAVFVIPQHVEKVKTYTKHTGGGGQTGVKRLKIEVVSLMEIIKNVAAGNLDISILKLEEAKLKAIMEGKTVSRDVNTLDPKYQKMGFLVRQDLQLNTLTKTA